MRRIIAVERVRDRLEASADEFPAACVHPVVLNVLARVAVGKGGWVVGGVLEVARSLRCTRGSGVLLLHLGGPPAVHAYANQFGSMELARFAI
jgi:hypothetical protein